MAELTSRPAISELAAVPGSASWISSISATTRRSSASRRMCRQRTPASRLRYGPSTLSTLSSTGFHVAVHGSPLGHETRSSRSTSARPSAPSLRGFTRSNSSGSRSSSRQRCTATASNRRPSALGPRRQGSGSVTPWSSRWRSNGLTTSSAATWLRASNCGPFRAFGLSAICLWRAPWDFSIVRFQQASPRQDGPR